MPPSRHDEGQSRLIVGGAYVEGAPREVWEYEVSGKQVLTQWFGYRKQDRQELPMGDNRPTPELNKIRPESWPAEYTTGLLNALHVLGRLVGLEEAQAELLEEICPGRTISVKELEDAGAIAVPAPWRKKLAGDSGDTPSLFAGDPD